MEITKKEKKEKKYQNEFFFVVEFFRG